MAATVFSSETSHAKGLAIGFFGLLVLSPDSLLIRLISVGGWTLVFWRGLLMGTTLMLAVAVTNRGRFVQTVRSIGRVGALASALQAAGSICFVTAPRFIPAPEFSLVVLLEMVFGPYWVWLGLGDRPPNSALLGGGIVLATLIVHSVVSIRLHSILPKQ